MLVVSPTKIVDILIAESILHMDMDAQKKSTMKFVRLLTKQ